jgi:integrase
MRHKTRYPQVYYRLDAKGNRRYQISYTDSNNKRVFKTVEGNERDALQQRNDILRRMHRGEKVVSSRMTVEDLANDYLKTQTGHLKDSTLLTYDNSLKWWVIPKIGKQRISQVDVNTIADLVAELREELTAGTIRTCITPMSRMFSYAVRRGWVNSNPVTALDRQERPQGASRRMRILSSDEIKLLLSVKSKYRLLLMTAIFTGLRKGELLALEWSDVDLSEGLVRVREGKTEAASRSVVMPDFLVKALAAEMKTEGKVFQFERRNCNRALENALEKVKVEHLRFHDLRHTFASILLGQGMDITYVSEQLGHANPATTLRVYAKLYDPAKRKEEARKKMQESFSGVVA